MMVVTAPKRLLPLLSAPHLREEALMVCGHLEAEDIACLVCVASSGATAEDRQLLWQAYFIIRWGGGISMTSSTLVRILRSWFDEAEFSPTILSVGFCARSAFDHLFWFLPYARALQTEHMNGYASQQSSQLLAWQSACRAHARGRGFVYCSLCDTLEVAPPGPVPPHFRRRWVRPCACAANISHLKCLEQRLMRVMSTSHPEASLTCSTCGVNYRVSSRFPETFLELCAATIHEWKWLIRRCCMTAAFYFWLYGIASYYCGQDGMANELHGLLIMTAAMMSISLSPRFHRSVQKIWSTPHRSIYFHLFCFFALQNYLVSLRAMQPPQWMSSTRHGPVVAAFHQLHTLARETQVGSAVLIFMSVLYALTASGVIFCFWKTSVRVPTIADAENISSTAVDMDRNDTAVQRQFAHCGLCQLGLCLDNTCM